MTPEEGKLRKMILAETVTRKGNKFVRHTIRSDWRDKFCQLIESLGGEVIITNDTAIATLPDLVIENVTNPLPWRGGRKPGRTRQTWGTTFGPNTKSLAEDLAEKLGLKGAAYAVDLAIREMAEREGII